MPIKNREQYLKYQREYNKKRKEGCRNLHPESAISPSQPVYTPANQQGVTTTPISQVQGCKPSLAKQIPNIPINTIPSNVRLGAASKLAKPAKEKHPKTSAIPGSTQPDGTKKIDFSQLRIKRPITVVGAIDHFRLLEEIAEALRKGDPVSGEEVLRLRAVGAKV